MFRVKICGITRVEDALAVAAAGADAVGLNFYPKSPRHVDPATAERIIKTLPPGVCKAGLFVNADAQQICQYFDRLGLDLIQLHGDEPPELLAQLGNRPVMRAFRVGHTGLEPVRPYLNRCRDLGCEPKLTLLDSSAAGVYGGTGKVADWTAIADYRYLQAAPPLVLGGGLTPQNVAAAIEAVRPHAVDTASGVESTPGKKDPALVEAFVRAARAAFAIL